MGMRFSTVGKGLISIVLKEYMSRTVYSFCTILAEVVELLMNLLKTIMIL